MSKQEQTIKRIKTECGDVTMAVLPLEIWKEIILHILQCHDWLEGMFSVWHVSKSFQKMIQQLARPLVEEALCFYKKSIPLASEDYETLKDRLSFERPEQGDDEYHVIYCKTRRRRKDGKTTIKYDRYGLFKVDKNNGDFGLFGINIGSNFRLDSVTPVEKRVLILVTPHFLNRIRKLVTRR
jgi:hypothetical protein